jgi:hypothetical protein
MSVFSPTKPLTVREIELKQAAQRQVVLDLEQRIRDVADVAPLSDEHRRADAELNKAHADLHLLNQAHAAAVAREQATLEANRVKIAESQRLAALGHGRALVKHAEALQASLAETMRLFCAVEDERAKMHRATPIGATVHDDCLTAYTIKQCIFGELWRLAGVAGAGDSIGRRSDLLFPGIEHGCPPGYVDNPAAIPPMMNRIRAEIENFKTAIGKKAD